MLVIPDLIGDPWPELYTIAPAVLRKWLQPWIPAFARMTSIDMHGCYQQETAVLHETGMA